VNNFREFIGFNLLQAEAVRKDRIRIYYSLGGKNEIFSLYEGCNYVSAWDA